jgi:hypothetical protein
MGVRSFTLKDSTTTLGTTGGVDQAFAEIAGTRLDAVRVGVTTDTVEQERRTVEFSSIPAPVAPSSATGYGKSGRKLLVRIPIEVATDVWDFIQLKIDATLPVTATAANISATRIMGAQLLFDSELDGFWNSGAKS